MTGGESQGRENRHLHAVEDVEAELSMPTAAQVMEQILTRAEDQRETADLARALRELFARGDFDGDRFDQTLLDATERLRRTRGETDPE